VSLAWSGPVNWSVLIAVRAHASTAPKAKCEAMLAQSRCSANHGEKALKP